LFGARVVREIFQRWKTSKLRGYLVWIPMLAADDLKAALGREAFFQDERIHQSWDGERALGQLVSRSLGLSRPIA
jgi:hypothetical protein